MARSGLQKSIFQLYRELLRTALVKDPSKKLYRTVRDTFREDAASVNSKEWNRIEHMIRQGYKKKKLMEMPGFSHAHRH